MAKYSKEFKIKLVLEYLSGESVAYELVVKIYNIPFIHYKIINYLRQHIKMIMFSKYIFSEKNKISDIG